MKMKWKKLGLLMHPGKHIWIETSAMFPYTLKLDDQRYRIYYSGRDKFLRARGGSMVVNMKNRPFEVEDISPTPSFDIGELGCFDDCGVIPSCHVEHDGKIYMYYCGISQAVVTNFNVCIGLATSTDNGLTFERYSKAPVLGRNRYDPYLTAAPWILVENGLWKMWYQSGRAWIPESNNKFARHYYNIKYADSHDGITWNTYDNVCIDFKKDEYSITRPVIVKKDGVYKMWYCYRGGWNTYRIGYAESSDGLKWERQDGKMNFEPSLEGWDSDMLCYPHVFEHDGQLYLLYNGNGYGKTGFGAAVLETT
jgi:hypothetical protein